MTVCPMRDAGAAPQPHFRGAPPHRGKQRASTRGRKDEEFVADFCLVARRALSDSEHKLFRYHFLLGADRKLCTRKLGIDRGAFFHPVCRIEQKLGRVFREIGAVWPVPVGRILSWAVAPGSGAAYPALPYRTLHSPRKAPISGREARRVK
jgi:hypothetical protein